MRNAVLIPALNINLKVYNRATWSFFFVLNRGFIPILT